MTRLSVFLLINHPTNFLNLLTQYYSLLTESLAWLCSPNAVLEQRKNSDIYET